MTILDGVTPYPPECATRYRALGFWEDRSLAQFFDEICERYAENVALCERHEEHESFAARREPITYRQLAMRVERLALHLLDLGVRPLDRFVMQLPNTAEFVYLYFALQKVGAIPVMALAAQRYHEIQ